VLSNRFAKAALTEGLADADNNPTARHDTLYRRWSLGGAGLVITGNVQVDRRFLERPGNVVVDEVVALEALKAYAKAGTVAGNHLWMQINHPGRQTPLHVHASPLAPSAVPVALPGFGRPVAMTEAAITETIARFGYAASVARAAGFTGVQIHAAHGYLISQFLSPLANQRTDQWGGSLENRARFLLRVVRAVRAEVGPDFPVSVKLNSADFQQGGFTSDECLQVVRWLEQEGIDLLEVSGGTYEQPQMVVAGRTKNADPLLDRVRSSTVKREAYFLHYAAALRSATSTPLMVTGGFRSLAAMEQALHAGSLDVVGLGRPLITNPEGPQQLLDGTLDRLSAQEQTLRLEPAEGADAATSLADMRGWGIQSWFCVQLLRLGDGKEPDTTISVYDALQCYRTNEAQAMQRRVQNLTRTVEQ
jgi:2,4-dienoyl-CoA reductase-like NADH-dependent reductase (Old Yellow Enzyme family)